MNLQTLLLSGLSLCFCLSAFADPLPTKYSSFTTDAVSPNGQYGIIYPKRPNDGEDITVVKNYLVALTPFGIIKELPLDNDTAYFADKNHAGFFASWSPDSRSVAVDVEGRWGPAKVFAISLDDKGQVKTLFELMELVSNRAEPILKKDFPSFEEGGYVLERNDQTCFTFNKLGQLIVILDITSDPKEMGGPSAWNATFTGVFDLTKGAFISSKVEKSNPQ